MKTTKKAQFTEPERFFFAHAGFSYDPQRETADEGRARCARQLAKAETWAKQNLSFEWSIDRDCDSSSFSDEDPSWWLWQCVAKGENADLVASLHAIDFGRNGEPWGDPYKRTVEAELALEAMPEDARA